MLAENLQKVQENIAAALAKRTEKKVTGDHVTLVAGADRTSGPMASDRSFTDE